jgi:hypothetical protein
MGRTSAQCRAAHIFDPFEEIKPAVPSPVTNFIRFLSVLSFPSPSGQLPRHGPGHVGTPLDPAVCQWVGTVLTLLGSNPCCKPQDEIISSRGNGQARAAMELSTWSRRAKKHDRGARHSSAAPKHRERSRRLQVGHHVTYTSERGERGSVTLLPLDHDGSARWLTPRNGSFKSPHPPRSSQTA